MRKDQTLLRTIITTKEKDAFSIICKTLNISMTAAVEPFINEFICYFGPRIIELAESQEEGSKLIEKQIENEDEEVIEQDYDIETLDETEICETDGVHVEEEDFVTLEFD